MQTKYIPKARALLYLLVVHVTLAGAVNIGLAADADEVVAVVNGEKIDRMQLEPFIDEYKKKVQKTQVSAEEKVQLLKNLIRRNLILQQEETRKLRQSEEISKRVKEYENQLVLEAYVKRHVLDFLIVGEEEAKQYYVDNLHQFASPPKVRASHILLRSEAEAKMVLEKLQTGGDFAELARQYSIDLPMAFEGGSIGTITKGRSLPQLEEALFILNEGEYSGIVKTQFGWHILRVDEKITVPYIPYEEVKDKIKVILKREKEVRAYEGMTQQLENKANITIYENRL